MAQIAPELLAHKEWIGQIQQIGLVVAPHVLVKHGVFVDRQKAIEKQARLRELVGEESDGRVEDLPTFVREILEWPDGLLAGTPGGPELPDSLTIALPEYEDRLSPTYALPASDVVSGFSRTPAVSGDVVSGFSRTPDSSSRTGAESWLALIQVVVPDADFDRPTETDRHHGGWRASPHARLERLLRDTGVPIGLLFNSSSLRLLYAPRGESSGYLTFRFVHLTETLGRPMVGALYALLAVERVTTDRLPDTQQLPALLRESRKYQNEVSTALAGQVLEALWELLRGFQRANDDSKGALLAEALREEPREVYGGLLSTLMRLVFILYAEDRGLMPQSAVYQRHYSVSGLFERLREDAARYPDTMDARFGAWVHLLTLFRLIHDGGSHGDLRLPERRGRLFDPDAYPFLEGRPIGSARNTVEPIDPPRISDGVVFRVLRNLLILGGERVSYRALDVEQIGSVYEAMMGFALETAKGPSIAVGSKHIVVNLADLLEQKGKDRASWLRERAELKVSSDAVAKAGSVEDLVAALGSKVSRYTPHVLKPAAMYLQPTEERRRSGSHYTPRSLTEPIVRTTLRPILERLGDSTTPEQILDLKVCDPAMGSGAFLVEACRLLGERLVRAWEVHKSTPKVPDDEDALTYARRLVAERCLYGVDKNVFAVELAKLSLWLATLAREHPFTFLDHALRHGDSLVGLSREQIACFNWEVEKQIPLLRSLIDERVSEAQRLREQIQGLATSDDVPRKEHLWRDAEDALADVRLIGDLVVSAFFEPEKPKDRKTLRAAYSGKVEGWLSAVRSAGSSDPAALSELTGITGSLREGDHPISPFHWEIEFPEVFTRPNGGFDVVVGNPPFAGKNTIAAAQRESYLPWLLQIHEDSHGNADLVAHFYRRAFNMLRRDGTFGLIATNTIGQGDTRATGLRWIRTHGGTIYSARRRRPWPGASAVVVSVVHVARGVLAAPYALDGRPVDRITAFLFHAGGDEDPLRLRANENKSFQGSIVLGMGFTFDDTDKSSVASPLALMYELIRKNPRNAERIFPYIGGEEVNESPTHAHHRYVINFGQMPLRRDDLDGTWVDADGQTRGRWLRTGVVPSDYPDSVAADWPDLLAIVEEKVKPERLRLSDNPDAVRRKAFWWQWGRYTPALFQAIRDLDRVLILSRVADAFGFSFLPAGTIYSEQLVVVGDSTSATFAALQSRAHEGWARFLGSSMKDDLRYTPSDCFETFPFPPDWETNGALEQVGREYYDFRGGLMVLTDEGLTKIYNRFHDPDERNADIVKLRELHDGMDRAVLDAYGWTDIQPRCEFILDYEDEEGDSPGKPSKKRKPYRYRWPDETRDEVLGRLLELNAKRAREEARAGGQTESEANGSAQRKKSKNRTPVRMPLLGENS